MRNRDLELCCIMHLLNNKYILPPDIDVIIIKMTRIIEKPLLLEKAKKYHCQRLFNPMYGVVTDKVCYIRSLKKILADDFRRDLEKKITY